MKRILKANIIYLNSWLRTEGNRSCSFSHAFSEMKQSLLLLVPVVFAD